MPRQRPRQVAETGRHAAETLWFVVAHNDDPETPIQLRVYRPAGGRRKAQVLLDREIPPNTLAQLVPDDGSVLTLDANHQMYATVHPPLKTAGARLERFDTRLLPPHVPADAGTRIELLQPAAAG